MTVAEPPVGFWRSLRHIGPGIIVSASIVGSGELIVTTRLGAKAGFTLLWLVFVSCVLKVFLQMELGRYAVVSGESTLRAFARLPGPRLEFQLGERRLSFHWLTVAWATMGFFTLLQLGGILSALARLLAFEGLGLEGVSEQLWNGLFVFATVALLITGRYRAVERTSTVLVCTFTAVTIVAVVALQSDPVHAVTSREIGSGLIGGVPAEDFLAAIEMFGITGVGASELVFYPYWCVEKGYARWVGPPDGTADRERRARGWIRVMRTDAWVSCAVYMTATAAFYLLGAAVLNRDAIVPDDDNVHEALASVYTTSLGDAGIWLYVFGAFAVLFSTFFVASASNSRVVADALMVFGFAKRGGEAHVQRVRWLGVLLPLFCWWSVSGAAGPVTQIRIGAVAQAALLPGIGIAVLWLRYRGVPRNLAPPSPGDVMLWLAALGMIVPGVYLIIR